MNQEALDAIKAREDAATRGPWRAWDRGVGWHIAVGDEIDEYGRPVRLLPEAMRTDIGREADAEFIAHARTDVPALIAEVERLRALLGEDDNKHLIDLRADGWTIKHPLSCRPKLFDCPVNRAAGPHYPAPPPNLGRFECGVDEQGEFFVGAQVAS